MSDGSPPRPPTYVPIVFGLLFIATLVLYFLSLFGDLPSGQLVYALLFLFVVPAAPPLLFGCLGGWLNRWWFAIGLTAAAYVAYVVWDVFTNPYGFAALYSVWVRSQEPPGMKYFHYWGITVSLLLLPYAFAVAAVAHTFVANRGRRQAWRRIAAGECWKCGYSLRCLTTGPCPECGTKFGERPPEPAAPPAP